MAPKLDKPASNKAAAKSATDKKLRKSKDKPNLVLDGKEKCKGKMRDLGGSMNDEFNGRLLGSLMSTLYLPASYSDEDKDTCKTMAAIAMQGFAPQDEVEGLMAAQAVGLHNAVMEAMRRAMIEGNTVEGRSYNLNAANKLAGTFARLVEALDKRRGKGGQKVTVEHVYVAAGGQAIVGNVSAGGGVIPQNGGQPYGQGQTIKSADAPVAPLLSQDTAGELVPVASNAEREVPAARRRVSRRTNGHG